MRCDKVKELLLTDYADNRLTDDLKSEIEKHLAVCLDCRAFGTQMAKLSAGIFKDEIKADAPQYLWHRIKHQIAEQKEEKRPWHVWGNIDIFQLIPRPAFVMAALVMLIMANVVVSKFVFSPKPQAKAGEILNYLEDVTDFGSDTPGLGTDMERFL